VAGVPDDPQAFLMAVMLGHLEPSASQLSAAKSLLAAASKGKKDERADRAKKAAGGRFAASAAPRLVVSNG
jgi:phage terminase small subunit